jgi:Reverse transcriptase (RNA-dependent DNA polymerase)
VAQREHLEAEITKWVNKLLSGSLDREVAPYIASAPLIPLRKPDGGTRPIAVGEIWRRLASKCAVRMVQGQLSNYLQPLQVGVAVKNGAESVILEAQHFVDQHGNNSNKVLVLLDFKNAFNSIGRDAMFQQVRLHAPSISPWVEYCYQQGAVLYAGDACLASEMGVQQGDPLGPLLFALTIQPILVKVQQECQLDFFRWYLDDGTIGGNVAEVANATRIIQQECARIGLQMNEAKCQVWWPTLGRQFAAFPTMQHIHDASGVVLLGGPVGIDGFAATVVEAKTHSSPPGQAARTWAVYFASVPPLFGISKVEPPFPSLQPRHDYSGHCLF